MSVSQPKPRGQIPAIKKKKKDHRYWQKSQGTWHESPAWSFPKEMHGSNTVFQYRKQCRQGAGEACPCVYQWAVLPGPIKGDVLTIDCHIPVALISLLCDSITGQVGCQTDREGQKGSGSDKPRAKGTCCLPPVPFCTGTTWKRDLSPRGAWIFCVSRAAQPGLCAGTEAVQESLHLSCPSGDIALGNPKHFVASAYILFHQLMGAELGDKGEKKKKKSRAKPTSNSPSPLILSR